LKFSIFVLFFLFCIFVSYSLIHTFLISHYVKKTAKEAVKLFHTSKQIYLKNQQL